MGAQQAPWQSGRRRPQSRKTTRWKRVQRSVGKTLRKHPMLGLVVQIAFAVLAVVLLVTGLLLENVLFFLATTLSALGGVATRRAIFLEQERQRQASPKVTPPPADRPRPRKTTSKPAGGATPPPKSDGVLRCTETKQPLAGDNKCTCASRHITTEKKAQQFGRPVGSPYGRRNKPGKVNTDKAGASR